MPPAPLTTPRQAKAALSKAKGVSIIDDRVNNRWGPGVPCPHERHDPERPGAWARSRTSPSHASAAPLHAMGSRPGLALKTLVSRFPMPLDATTKDDVYVGRIRKDISRDDGKVRAARPRVRGTQRGTPWAAAS